MKKLNVLLVLILFTSCTTNKESHLVTLNTDPRIQAEYKANWLTLTKNINSADTGYKGETDIYGGGALLMTFLFDAEGNLQNHCPAYEGSPAQTFPLHSLIKNHNDYDLPNSSFLDEKTAIMFMPSSASPKLENSIYIVRISNNTIYRTKNPNGFTHIANWDGKTVDPTDLMILGKKQP